MSYGQNSTGTCPHCGVAVRFEAVRIQVGGSTQHQDRVFCTSLTGHVVEIGSVGCPACGALVLSAIQAGRSLQELAEVGAVLWPDAAVRVVPAEVGAESPEIAEDFKEAAAVLPKSRKASAALARRCLQSVLVEKGGAKKKNLAEQIDEVIGGLPSSLAANVDSVRQVGNFAAHPMKSTSTGEIVEVEENEAEWLLDVLEEVFDFYYVAPARAAAKRSALNQKLADAGKPPLKAP